MNAQDLTDQIRLAFPATEFLGPITSCDCEGCMGIRAELPHKRWDRVPAWFLDLTCSPTPLEPEAFNAFLPAYLLRALDDLSGRTVVLEFTVYSLCPNAPEEDGAEEHSDHEDRMRRLVDRARLMSRDQIEAVRSFLVFVRENASDAACLRPFIASALPQVWQLP